MDPLTPVVFLHAFPLEASMWAAQLPALGSRPAIIPNFPGFGGRPPGASDLDSFASSVLEDMDHAGIEAAVVVGLSMGGYVAFRLMAQAKNRVMGLVLADTRAGPDDEAGRLRRTEQAARVREQGTGWLSDAFAPALLGETTRRERPGVEAKVRGLIEGADAEGVARALEAMRDRPDSSGILGGIRVPVLVMVGEEDTLTPPAEARKIAGGVRDGRLVVLPGAGHLSNLENPEGFNQALTSFLR